MAKSSPLDAYMQVRRSRQGLIVSGLLYIVAAYALLIWAFDSGSYFYYIGAVGAICGIVRSIKGLVKSYGKPD